MDRSPFHSSTGHSSTGHSSTGELCAHVQRLARRHVSDPDGAEDLAQRVWLAALEGSADARKPEALLRVMARRIAIDSYRSGSVRRMRELGDAAGAAEIDGVDEQLALNEARRLVLRAVAELRQPYRDVVRMRFFLELPPREIAQRLGVPVETVNTRLKRGLALLRAKLERRFEGGRSFWALLVPWRRGRLAWTVAAGAALTIALTAPTPALLSAEGRARPSGSPFPAEAVPSTPLALEPRVRAPRSPSPASIAPPASANRHSASGRILDALGLPVAFARVAARGEADDEILAEATSTSDGRFVLEDLPPSYRLEAHDAGRVSSELVTAEACPMDVAGLVLALHPAHRQEGFLPGASRGRVMAVPFTQASPSRPAGAEGLTYQPRKASAEIEADGHFSLPPLPAGPHVLVVDAPGFAPTWRAFEIPSSQLEVELESGVALEVLVRGPDGAPVSGAVVHGVRPRLAGAPLVGRGWLRLETRATTGTDGRCRLDTQRRDAGVLIEVLRDERPVAIRYLEAPLSQDQVEIQLHADRALEGRVRDASGQAVAEALVVLSPPAAPREWTSSGFQSKRGAQAYTSTRTDRAGAFRFPAVPAEAMVVRVGHPTQPLAAEQSLAGDERSLDLWVSETEPVTRLTVVDRRTGRPLPSFRLASMDRSGSLGRVLVGGAGVDRVPGAKGLRVAILAEGYSATVLRLDEPGPERLVELDPSREVEVRVVDRDDRPLAGALIRAREIGGGAVWIEAGPGQFRTALTTASDGSLLLKGLPARPLEIEVWSAALTDPVTVPQPALADDLPVLVRLPFAQAEAAPAGLRLELRRAREGGPAALEAPPEPWSGPLELGLRDQRGRIVLALRGTVEAGLWRPEEPVAIETMTWAADAVTFFARPAEAFWTASPQVLKQLPAPRGGLLEVRLPDGGRIEGLIRDEGTLVLELPDPR